MQLRNLYRLDRLVARLLMLPTTPAVTTPESTPRGCDHPGGQKLLGQKPRAVALDDRYADLAGSINAIIYTDERNET